MSKHDYNFQQQTSLVWLYLDQVSVFIGPLSVMFGVNSCKRYTVTRPGPAWRPMLCFAPIYAPGENMFLLNMTQNFCLNNILWRKEITGFNKEKTKVLITPYMP